ncbi:MAG TPA: superoxide dismutase [Phycisphaerales bacterium]|nr:superoxide dismutase [Phycisphaerales bacterium]
MPFTLPDLPYSFDALMPYIDARTMEIHHDKHHKAYVDNANKALDGTKWANMDPVEVIKHLGDLPDDKRTAVRNNAGGHVNHSMFWKIMAPASKGGGGEPTGDLAKAINAAYGTIAHFKEEFAKAAATRFGSGWAWLCVKADGSGVQICSTPNQDSPFMGEKIAGCGGKPILGLDVWEHAYYLHYQNRRPDYVSAWWNVVNWAEVAKNYAAR